MHEAFTLTTPALLFSAVSLILLAYTNRFIAYTGVVRNLLQTISRESNLGAERANQQPAQTVVPHPHHAVAWGNQPVFMCGHHVTSICGIFTCCCLFFRGSAVVALCISCTFHLGNTNFCKSA
jgi:hypothetical protein